MRKILVGGWVVFWTYVIVLLIVPRFVAKMFGTRFFRLYSIILVLSTAIYGISILFRSGMKSAGRR